jgi:hypothetical protein
MQPLTWYVRRLGRMSSAELAWRFRSTVRDGGDWVRQSLGLAPSLTRTDRAWPPLSGMPVLCAVPPGAWRDAAEGSPEAGWRDALVREADDLVAHRFTYLSLTRQPMGSPIDWNRDHESGVLAPLRFSPGIDYRDPATAGDAKIVWEPNRHVHLMVLARAYRATGDATYAQAVVDHVLEWMEACPFGRGMNWRSPLELAIRAINWTFALAFISPSGADAAALDRMRHGLDLHVGEIARKLSRESSANNHLIGEAAGVFVAATSVPGLSDAVPLADRCRTVLETEIVRQTHEDGGNREQAFGYHLFVLQFLAVAALVAHRSGRPFSERYLATLGSAVDFAEAALAAGPAPMFGDADEGYVIDLGGRGDGRSVVALARAVLGRPRTQPPLEPESWVRGDTPGPASATPPDRLEPRAFPDSGVYLLQSGRAGTPDALSVTFTCGELGFGAIAAHGHAGALGLTLRVGGHDVLVDPGTYDYFRFPEWRTYFRSTRAHNTIQIDGEDQSVMLGPFMWGRRAACRCLDWDPGPDVVRVAGEHDGYARLASPVVHRRSVTMDATARVVSVDDRLDGQGAHDIALHLHFAPDVVVRPAGPSQFDLQSPAGLIRLQLDPCLHLSVIRGSEAPILGWTSPGYHRRHASPTVRAALRASLPVTLRWSFAVFTEPPGEQP